jgi:hypothetical protein
MPGPALAGVFVEVIAAFRYFRVPVRASVGISLRERSSALSFTFLAARREFLRFPPIGGPPGAIITNKAGYYDMINGL